MAQEVPITNRALAAFPELEEGLAVRVRQDAEQGGEPDGHLPAFSASRALELQIVLGARKRHRTSAS